MDPRRDRNHARSGFTFMEVLAVFVTLSVMAAAIVAGMDPGASVAVEADILRAHLGFAQTLAMANNTADWRVLFASHSYTLQRNDGSAWFDSPFPWPNESSATHGLPGGVSFLSAGNMTLDEWGAPPVTFSVVLADGTRQEQVSVVGFTGLVQ